MDFQCPLTLLLAHTLVKRRLWIVPSDTTSHDLYNRIFYVWTIWFTIMYNYSQKFQMQTTYFRTLLQISLKSFDSHFRLSLWALMFTILWERLHLIFRCLYCINTYIQSVYLNFLLFLLFFQIFTPSFQTSFLPPFTYILNPY